MTVHSPLPPQATSASMAPSDRPLDLVHLSRMTCGDRSLEREVLQLFVRQSTQLIGRLHGAPCESLAALAHTLKGSALGVGAWRVATQAEAVECAMTRNTDALPMCIASLEAAVDEAQSIISDLLRAH